MTTESVTDPARHAAERVVRHYLEGQRLLPLAGGVPRPIEESTDHAVVLARTYLTDHPADDAEPVTEEWLLSIGFRKGGSPAARPLYLDCVTFDDVGEGVVSVCDFMETAALGRRFRTRGRVRRLLAALGVKQA